MRLLGAYVILAAMAWGQEPAVEPPAPATPKDALQRQVEALKAQAAELARLRNAMAALKPATAATCAIPLLEFKPQPGVEFSMKQVAPPENIDPEMARAPAVPSCADPQALVAPPLPRGAPLPVPAPLSPSPAK